MALHPCRMIHDCSRWGLSCVEGGCKVPGYHKRCLPGVVDCMPGYFCHSHSRRCVTFSENHTGYHGDVIDCRPDEFYDERLGLCRLSRKLGEVCEFNECEMGTMCSDEEKVCRPTCVLGSITFGCPNGFACRKYEENNVRFAGSPLGYCRKSFVSITTSPTKNTSRTAREGNNPMVVIGLFGFFVFAFIGFFLFRMSTRKRTVVYTNPTSVGTTYVPGPNGATVYYTNTNYNNPTHPSQSYQQQQQQPPPP